ncbi:two-component system regulatory protein YycI [Sinanaerobacter sp. ZZT-01]|uniref:two-component system regulatory protein YycI n=1 Tax=Sinanaerobacter sp. ZZT-01 TaxID=3111540 RepID=UPI002D764AB9|nr:two-component system regulatory protein YycI [Sinanaerobacter sp. ZZT-01]WRR94747.1 two-component system regulatory protein YycI [Sinanaerobacter sp. ZZT-01]
MDWTKAKTILIIALLITNLIFLTSYFFTLKQPNFVENDVTKNTEELLSAKKIYLEAEIPKKTPTMAVLSVKSNELKNEIKQRALENQRPLSENQTMDEDYISLSKEFIENCGVYDENVEFQSIKKENSKIYVRFKNVYEKIPIEESYMVCIIEDGKVIDFQRKWFDAIGFGETKKKVITASNALIKFMVNKEEDKKSSSLEGKAIQIKDISLVYWLYSYQLDHAVSTSEDTAFPAWRITYNNDEMEYILAYQQ